MGAPPPIENVMFFIIIKYYSLSVTCYSLGRAHDETTIVDGFCGVYRQKSSGSVSGHPPLSSVRRRENDTDAAFIPRPTLVSSRSTTKKNSVRKPDDGPDGRAAALPFRRRRDIDLFSNFCVRISRIRGKKICLLRSPFMRFFFFY